MHSQRSTAFVPTLVAFSLLGSACGQGDGGTDAAGARQGEPPPLSARLSVAQDSLVPNAVPFTIEFVPADSTGLPALQSYSLAAIRDDQWLIVGGRHRQGLHTFEPAPAQNFPDTLTNYFMWVIDPTAPSAAQLDLRLLPTDLGVPLMSSNQAHYYDRSDSTLYVAGGYGWNQDASDMRTFSTFYRIPAPEVAEVVVSGLSAQQKADSVAGLIDMMQDSLFRVTGGELARIDAWFYLVFGQVFDGQYRPFSTGDFVQEYTEEIRFFQLFPDSFAILSSSVDSRKGQPGAPFHRRDLSVVDDVDPTTGGMRVTAFGGVFPPGFLGGYAQPVYIRAPNDIRIEPDTVAGAQRFSQYTTPVVVAYDPANRAVHRTFFGGIGHYFFFQTHAQDSVYRYAASQNRDDGLPWVADITVFSETAQAGPDGSRFSQYILPEPIPDTLLLGATVDFIGNPSLISDGAAMTNGVLRLDRITGRRQVGWVYGGVQAQYPLPYIPNTGTWATAKLWRVFLSPTPSPGVPARLGHQAAHSPTTQESVHEVR